MNVLLVVLAFWLPGLVFGAAVRLRGWLLAAVAPLLTFGIVSLGVPVLGGLGIRWTTLDVALWTLVLSAVGFGLAHLVQRFTARRHPDWAEKDAAAAAPPRTLRQHLLIGAGVAAGSLVGVVTFLRGARGLNQVQQGWDAPFHANLVRWIAEHGDARPSTVGTIANLPNQTNYFYPDTYHALLALVFDKAGLAMMPTLNMAALTVVLCVPIGVAALCHVWRMPPLAVAAAAAVSASFTTFPYDSLWRGPLWPYVAGVAMIPAALALARLLLEPRGIAGPVAIGLGVAGLIGLHTSVAFVVVVYFLLILLAVLFRLERIDWRRSAPSLVATIVLAVVCGLPLALPSLYNAGGVTSAFWASEATVSGGLGETLTFSPMAAFPQWWIGVPALIGIGLLVRHRRMLWMVGAYVVLGVLFMFTVSIESPLIHTLTGVFYNDHYRIGALLPLAGAVAFGEFTDTAARWFARKAGGRLPNVAPATLTAVGVVLLVVVVGGLSRGGYVGRNAARLQLNYSGGPTVSNDEREAFSWLAAHTAPGEHVMNGKADGSVWMYALDGVQPVEWTFYGAEPDTPAGYLSVYLNDIDKYPHVRELLTDLKVRYVFVGKGMVTKDTKSGVGLDHLESGTGFKLVFRNPGASVYEIEGQQGVVTSGAAIGSAAGDGQ
ncbi:hypothetical protein M8542_00610 [Amycolatopsis sp. OK19-0408]|uniref:Uncharacterized protein n=1 Tax=Amycolatopsis iheyensis TaxID=2945988 RepID=A0A9X2N6S1_9PSEU|nr:DUF6541 family protein [Amycolatopsis iheyensis]MCR6481309.1 hypothetical protein [Amycolatopsis iheyensis]